MDLISAVHPTGRKRCILTLRIQRQSRVARPRHNTFLNMTITLSRITRELYKLFRRDKCNSTAGKRCHDIVFQTRPRDSYHGKRLLINFSKFFFGRYFKERVTLWLYVFMIVEAIDGISKESKILILIDC